MRIRPFTPPDIPSILAIQAGAGLGDGWRETDYLALAHSEGLIVVAEAEEETASTLIGFLALRRALDEAEILTLAVDARHRRLGAGRALVRAACEWMRVQGIATAYLEVRASNAAAIRLYSSAGFAFHSARKGYYHNPEDAACIMRLNIRSPSCPG
ncbi:MAG: GNAT family N-acetyltransferase [Terriglobia bacterium]